MAGVKPLIFFHPLSDTLLKLKEVLEETAEEEGLSIHETSDIKELTQLLTQVGPSLSLFSHPKQCAMSLQAHKRLIKRIQSKTILLTPKQIPRKTLDKFMKVGLTDCIVEPIAPKTLLYKVRLLLRSLPSTDEVDSDYNAKFGEGGEQKGDEKELKSLAGKKEEEDSQESPREVEGSIDDIKAEKAIEDLKGEIEKSRESIDGHYRGSVSEAREIEEDDEAQTRAKDDRIETHYKGKKGDSSADTIENDHMKGESEVDQISDEDEIHKLKQGLELEIEEDDEEFVEKAEEIEEEEETPKENLELEIEDDLANEKEKLAQELDTIETHYKGKLGQTQELEDEAEDSFLDEKEIEEETGPMRGKTGQALSLEEEDAEFSDRPEAKDNGPSHMKGKMGQALEVEEEDEYLDKTEPELDEDASPRKEKLDLDIEDDDEQDPEENQKKVENIDGYLRGGAAKKLDVEEDEEENYRDQMLKKAKQELEDEDDFAFDEEGSASANLKGKVGQALDIEEDDEELNSHEKDIEDEELDDLKKDLETQKIEDDNLMRGKVGKKLKEEEEDDYETSQGDDFEKEPAARKKGPDLDIEDDEEKSKRPLKKVDDIEKYYGREREKREEEVDDNWDIESDYRDSQKKTRSHSARVDKIDTYYGRKKKQEDDDWEADDEFDKDEEFVSERKEKKRREKEEKSGPKEELIEEKEIDYGAKEEEQGERALIREVEDLGEQTINYKKLKEEFEEMESWGDVKARYRIEEGEAKKKKDPVIKTVKKIVVMEDGTEQVIEEEVEVEEDTEMIYHPDSKGLEIAIQALNIYEDRQTKPIQMFTFLANVINNQYGGVTSFVMRNKDTGEFEDRYVGYLELMCDSIPYIPVESEDAWPAPATLNWESFRAEKLEKWTHSTIPQWSDETFQDKQIEFIYPFYEGVQTMGFAVVQFFKGFDQEAAGRLEVFLESTRGLYLENFHQGALRGEYVSAKKKSQGAKQEGEKKKGLFGKLFGKKAS